ncbi:MAG: nuclear transport factor 2 family protein [Chloroflexota bacterium]|nr:nuclear transport factor 2 family protein [Chloroflexota bacterium]
MDELSARAWLSALAHAWQTQDADAMAALFTEDATEQVDPFETPVRGREHLRKGFAWWMRDQGDIQIIFGNVDVIGARFYAEVDAAWRVASTGEKIQERGLLVCDMAGDKVRAMREFWKTRKSLPPSA